MKIEITATGKTIDEAIAAAKEQIGSGTIEMEYEIVEFPKKGILGIGSSPAVIKVSYNVPDESPARTMMENLIASMELNATVTEEAGEAEGEIKLKIDGEDAGILIGHHGETLDALQYLANLAANKREISDDGSKSKKPYVKVSVDIEDYRVKREDTLRQLARRMAARVLKYRRSVTLEPMNPYERRIIHSEIQDIEGVTTHSIGVDADRRIVITIEREQKQQ